MNIMEDFGMRFIMLTVGILLGIIMGGYLFRSEYQPFWWDKETRLNDYMNQLTVIEQSLDDLEKEKE